MWSTFGPIAPQNLCLSKLISNAMGSQPVQSIRPLPVNSSHLNLNPPQLAHVLLMCHILTFLFLPLPPPPRKNQQMRLLVYRMIFAIISTATSKGGYLNCGTACNGALNYHNSSTCFIRTNSNICKLIISHSAS